MYASASSTKMHRKTRAQQAQQPNRRNRGVVLTVHGWDKLQTAKAEVEFQENHGQRLTLEDLSDRTRLAIHTVSKLLGRKDPVDKQSLQYIFHAFGLELTSSDYTHPISPFEALADRQQNLSQDWREAIDVSVFLGREQELLEVRQWILEEHCRLVAILGIGGCGKSSLAVKLAMQIQSEFEIVIWRSLAGAPSIDELLESILSFLSGACKESLEIPASSEEKFSRLMECLQTTRCLLILDNAETLLSSGERVGKCREGYEDYRRLIRAVGEVPHQSCVLLTSREKSITIALLEGEKFPVRSLLLKGLKMEDVRSLFQHKGTFTGSDTDWHRLTDYYAGNPLSLKLVAAATQEMFNGEIAAALEYIEQGLLVFEDVHHLLNQQFDRLSHVEQSVLTWLADHQNTVTLAELIAEITTVASKCKVLEAINSLMRRSLIEKHGEHFSLQPVVQESILERFSERVC
ncbi:NB-ARC domain-containing protein [Phormidesmis sp. 146-35]